MCHLVSNSREGKLLYNWHLCYSATKLDEYIALRVGGEMCVLDLRHVKRYFALCSIPQGCQQYLQYSNSMWTVWKGAQQMVNSRTMVIIILTALFFFLREVKGKKRKETLM